MQGNLFSFCCRSAWNFVFTSFRHRVPKLGFFVEFSFFLGLELRCGLVLLSCLERLSGPVGQQAHSKKDANVWSVDACKLF